MTDRHMIAYALMALLGVAAVIAAAFWRSRARARRRRMTGLDKHDR